MTAFIIGLSILLLVIVILQISKLVDLYARILGDEFGRRIGVLCFLERPIGNAIGGIRQYRRGAV